MARRNINMPSEINIETANKITEQCCQQLATSRQYKKQRMAEIAENENLYLGVIEKSVRNPYNECFPFMAGFIDYYRAKIDDDSGLLFTHQSEADMKRAQKINAFYDIESNSIKPNALWNLKHRHAKFNALFSGVAIYHYSAQKNPEYESRLRVISHYDFHCEPRGGAMLEDHLFVGEADNIFKTEEDLKESKVYNQDQVKKLLSEYGNKQFKDNNDYENFRNNRARALGQDPVANNFTGQTVIKFAQFETTYNGKRYYVLFNEQVKVWIRICPIEEINPDGLYSYTAWHTNEDPDVFWSKAPADDARPLARIINTMINQELYNRQKRNYGQRIYDPSMFPNVAALADWRPDGLIPANTKNGERSVSSGLYEVKVGDLNGTLDLVTWLDQFTGKQTGHTSAGAGQAERDKKVGVFQGEIEQVDKLINVKNISFRTCLSQIGLRFKHGLDNNLTKEVAVKLMGPKGIEWTTLSPDDLKTDKDLSIIPVGGTSETLLKTAKDQKKLNAILSLTTVNPQWKERQILLLAGMTEEEIKDAFSSDTFATREILAEAAEAEEKIIQGNTPPLNRGADSNFMQHIVDYAINTENLTDEQFKALMDYAMAHTDIAVENEARNVKEMIRNLKMKNIASQVTPESTPTIENKNAPISGVDNFIINQ